MGKKFKRLWDKFGLVLFWVLVLTVIIYVAMLITDYLTSIGVKHDNDFRH